MIGDALLLLLVITAFAVVEVRNLFAATVLLGIYSLLMALTWTNMNAYDVAFTEAAVGAGISTILLVGALILTGDRTVGSRERESKGVNWPALLAVTLLGVALAYGVYDAPLGDPTAAPHLGVARYYIQQPIVDAHVPNMVTVTLASYRGYDTMFETAVIFTAGAGMILLLRRDPSDARTQPPGGLRPAAPRRES
ncbi:MAG: DUF4040 domain-containing protein [Planctomycetes bacterium]|nr:DUF4040 domain-containing protein [Planctomycetota bacterium]